MELSQENLENFTNSVIQVFGLVEKVGEGVKNFSAGDLVACGGGGFASHLEKILVPENLVVKTKKRKFTSLFNRCSWINCHARSKKIKN